MSQRFLSLGALVFMASSWCAAPALAQQKGDRMILATLDLNRDTQPDTIEGAWVAPGQLRPVSIHWGRGATQSERSTRIKLPSAWKRLEVSLTLLDADRDSARDMVFAVSGVVSAAGRDHDSLRTLVVFAQSGLDTVEQINLSTIRRGFQSSPFIAMDLRLGADLVDRRRRDFSGSASYRLLPIIRGEPDSTSQPRTPDEQFWLTVSPNPARHVVSVDAGGEPGDYTLMLVASNGRVVHRRSLAIENLRVAATSAFEIQDVPSGVYVVQLSRDGRTVTEYPCIILH